MGQTMVTAPGPKAEAHHQLKLTETAALRREESAAPWRPTAMEFIAPARSPGTRRALGKTMKMMTVLPQEAVNNLGIASG